MSDESRHNKIVDDIDRVIAAYEQIVRKNMSVEWDTIAAVAQDSTGEVIYEVYDTATDIGLTKTDLDAIDRAGGFGTAIAALKARFAREVAARAAHSPTT